MRPPCSHRATKHPDVDLSTKVRCKGKSIWASPNDGNIQFLRQIRLHVDHTTKLFLRSGMQPYSSHERGSVQPRILIATTTWWAMPARLALAFSQCGAQVSGLCPRGSPISKMKCLEREFRYRAADPLCSLVAAIDATQPDLLVPCDDRVVGHLHRLYARESSSQRVNAITRLIEKSLGSPAGYSISSSRWKLLQHAKQNGILVPETALIQGRQDLQRWVDEHGFPLVLKADGTWGGSGVRIVRSWPDADRAITELMQPLSVNAMLSHLSFHDFYPLFSPDRERRTEITVQAYVTGRCHNAMFSCWEGEVLDRLSVEVLFAQESLGASSVVRTRSAPDMERAGELIVRDLGVSGFCGLDFITQQETGAAYLIELNPRATQLGHLQLGGRDSLVKAMMRRMAGEPRKHLSPCVEQNVVFYPPAVRNAQGGVPLVREELHHDVPLEAPELMRELQRVPWNRRHASALLYMAVRRLLRMSSRRTAARDKVSSPSKLKIGA